MYKAFISYSHAADGLLAPALQSGLQRIAKPFYRLRAMRIFRDETSLHVTPKLWPTIQRAIGASEHFILMASPKAAASEWVRDEIDEWLRLQSGSTDKFYIVLTEGEIVWSDSSKDFDWEKTTALPRNLEGAFKAEPFFLDFRWARGTEHLSLRNPQFLRAIGKLAAALRDEELDTLIGEDVRQHRFFKLAAGVTIVVLAALLVLASGMAYYANVARQSEKAAREEEKKQREQAETAKDNETAAKLLADERRKEAEKQTGIAKEAQEKAERSAEAATQAAERERIAREGEEKQRKSAEAATARALTAEQRALRERDEARRQTFANASYALSQQDPTLALQLAAKAPSPEMNVSTGLAVAKAFNTGSWLYSHRFDGASDADVSRDGTHIAWVDKDKKLYTEELATGARRHIPIEASSVRILPSGKLLVWDAEAGNSTSRRMTLADLSGAQIASHDFKFYSESPLVCPSGEVMVTSLGGDGNSVAVRRMNPHTGEVSTLNLPRVGWSSIASQACLPGGAGIAFVISRKADVSVNRPNSIVVANFNGNKPLAITLPPYLTPTDIDIHPRDRRIAVYVGGEAPSDSGAGNQDAVVWWQFDESWRRPPEPKIISLPMSATDAAGGQVRFLPDGRMIVASQHGRTRLVNLDDEKRILIDDWIVERRHEEQERNPDDERRILINDGRAVNGIAVAPDGDSFVLSRRSGTATVYTSKGLVVGKLIGEPAVDGSKKAVPRLSFDGSGKTIITTTDNGARLWRRPRYELSPVHTATTHSRRERTLSAVAAVKGLEAEKPEAWIKSCDDSTAASVDDVGQIILCVRAFGRTDSINPRLLNDTFRMKADGSGLIDATTYRVEGHDFARVLILSPELIMRFVREEIRLRRIWNPDQSTIDAWVGPAPSGDR